MKTSSNKRNGKHTGSRVMKEEESAITGRWVLVLNGFSTE